MKTTIEIPDDLFRRTKATAALRGESLKDLITTALREHLDLQNQEGSEPRGWRKVFGKARPEQVAEVDAVVAEEFGRVEPEEWK